MKTFDYEPLPFGVCPDCLTALSSGNRNPAEIRLPGGEVLKHIYCSHREVGAAMLIRPGRPNQWKLITPIDVIAWDRYLILTAPAIAGALSVMAEGNLAGKNSNSENLQ